MKKCALYRCKQCFATMTDESDVRIDKDIVDWMFENEMEESKIGFILCTDGDNQSMGGALFDTAEDAVEAWNKRYKED